MNMEGLIYNYNEVLEDEAVELEAVKIKENYNSFDAVVRYDFEVEGNTFFLERDFRFEHSFRLAEATDRLFDVIYELVRSENKPTNIEPHNTLEYSCYLNLLNGEDGIVKHEITIEQLVSSLVSVSYREECIINEI